MHRHFILRSFIGLITFCSLLFTSRRYVKKRRKPQRFVFYFHFFRAHNSFILNSLFSFAAHCLFEFVFLLQIMCFLVSNIGWFYFIIVCSHCNNNNQKAVQRRQAKIKSVPAQRERKIICLERVFFSGFACRFVARVFFFFLIFLVHIKSSERDVTFGFVRFVFIFNHSTCKHMRSQNDYKWKWRKETNLSVCLWKEKKIIMFWCLWFWCSVISVYCV